jgi:HSP20 family protein
MWPGLMEPLRGLGERVAQFFAPSADASATDERYEINIELPGVKPDDIHVEVHDNVLMVHGEKRAAREERGRAWYFSERSFGSFSRSFRLPPDVAADEVDATVNEGVLTLRIPKPRPAARTARKIEVKTR